MFNKKKNNDKQLEDIFEKLTGLLATEMQKSVEEGCKINISNKDGSVEVHTSGSHHTIVVTLIGVLKRICEMVDIDKEMLDIMWEMTGGTVFDLSDDNEEEK